jgi:hypothetical protein
MTRAALLACVLGGCSMVSNFDGYTFTAATVDASDAAQLADVGTDATEPQVDASTDASDAAQLADVGTDAPTFDPFAPDCCGVGCAQCVMNATNPRRCFTQSRGWVCAADCGPTCER